MTIVRWAVYVLACLAIVASRGLADDTWVDISSSQIDRLSRQPWPGGCAGVVVNRLTGDVSVNIVGHGLWKSSDRGQTWTRLDGGVVTGRGECGWSVQVDQDDPRRVAVFSLDGDAGYTVDGSRWKKFTSLGRNWDFGSIDWAPPRRVSSWPANTNPKAKSTNRPTAVRPGQSCRSSWTPCARRTSA